MSIFFSEKMKFLDKGRRLIMIILIIKNNAGPGNQMFMYSKAYSLAKKYGHKILIISEISGYSVRQNILQNFCLDKEILQGFIRLDWTKNQYIFRFFRKIIFDVILKLPFFQQIYQPAEESRMYQNEPVLRANNIYVINGYWECHKYFDQYRNDLIRQFRPNYCFPKMVEDMINQVKGENSVVFHIRKGDFAEFRRLISNDYYENTLKKIKEIVDDPIIYLLTESDAVADHWCKDYGAKRILFDTEHKYIDEWYVMSKCKHHVIANSTYSWWSSYLSENENKQVMIPSLNYYLMAESDHNEIMYKNYYREENIAL